jgi:uncharacterized membrane protein YphA (DoxX/SURF4 family)
MTLRSLGFSLSVHFYIILPATLIERPAKIPPVARWSDPLMDIGVLVSRLLLAAVLTVAGLAKLVDRAGSRRALAEFGIPATLVSPLAILLPLAELVVAVALIPAATVWWGALGALGLLVVFTLGIGINLAQGRRPDCHCFGQLHSEPVGWPTLARNGLLLAVAGFVACGPRRIQDPALWGG